VDRGDFGYNMTAEFKLAGAFSDWQESSHGWRPDAERVRVFCDVMQGVETTLWLHTEPGDGVVVFTPVYPPFLRTVNANGRRIVECQLDADAGWRLDPERLSAVVDAGTKAILLCNPHNPTGRVLTLEELTTIADIAEKHDLLIISDEIWADIVHPGAKHIPMALVSEAAAARTVTVNAASKSFNVAGLRCAVAHLGHGGVASALKAIPSHVFGAVGSLAAEASLAAWTQGAPWLAETKTHLTSQRDHLASRLAKELPEVGFEIPEATYLAWLDFRALGLGNDPAKRLLESARGFARLNFATTRAILDAILDRIVEEVGSGR
jgi:cystathionine beta-lyase